MTLKMVAIGILALMGLSSVMTPKTFRLFLGGFGALCMALFWGLVVTGNHGDEESKLRPVAIAKLQELLGLQPDWEASASSKSQTILKDVKEGRHGNPSLQDLLPDDDSGQVRQPQPTKHSFPVLVSDTPIIVNRHGGSQDRWIAGFQVRISEYLKHYKKANRGDVGVDLLTYGDLDPSLIEWVGRKREDGSEEAYLVFSKKYANYVRLRGRQVLMKQRLKSLMYYAGAVAAVLILTFAGLKVLNRRSEPLHDQDYLRHSDISMV